MQNVITHSQKKLEKLKTVVGGHQELAALEKCISDEKTKNCYLKKSQLRTPRTTRGRKENAPRAAQRSEEGTPR
jgi:hypothetical protein